MTNQSFSNCKVRVHNVVIKGNDSEMLHRPYMDFQTPIKALEAMGLIDVGQIGSNQTALNMLKPYHKVEFIHLSEIKRENEMRKKKLRKKAEKKGYNREKLAPVAQTGKPMRRLNLSVEEITRKPVESSKNWKKAAEICRKQAKQAKRVNSSKPTEKSNKKLEKPAGLFSESIKVTKSKVAAKRAELENQYVPSTNNPQFKEYKGRNKRNKRGQVGTQTSFL